jgi:hypothetical protein
MALALAGVIVACVSDQGTTAVEKDCALGAETCPCNSGSCLSGLSCIPTSGGGSNVCVSLSDGSVVVPEGSVTPLDAGAPGDAGSITDGAVADASFVASNIPGCVAWFRADMGLTTTDGGVTAWQEQCSSKTATVNNTYLGDGGYPVLGSSLGQPAVFFPESGLGNAAASFNLSLASPIGGDVTVYMVGTSASPTGDVAMVGVWLDGADAAAGHTGLFLRGGLGMYFGDGISAAVVATSATYRGQPIAVGATTLNDGGALHVSDQKPSASGPMQVHPAMDRVAVGAILGSLVQGNAGWRGPISEVIIYRGTHDLATRGRVLDYFHTRYGLVIAN